MCPQFFQNAPSVACNHYCVYIYESEGMEWVTSKPIYRWCASCKDGHSSIVALLAIIFVYAYGLHYRYSEFETRKSVPWLISSAIYSDFHFDDTTSLTRPQHSLEDVADTESPMIHSFIAKKFVLLASSENGFL